MAFNYNEKIHFFQSKFYENDVFITFYVVLKR